MRVVVVARRVVVVRLVVVVVGRRVVEVDRETPSPASSLVLAVVDEPEDGWSLSANSVVVGEPGDVVCSALSRDSIHTEMPKMSNATMKPSALNHFDLVAGRRVGAVATGLPAAENRVATLAEGGDALGHICGVGDQILEDRFVGEALFPARFE